VSSAGNPAAIVTADGGLRIFFAGLTDSASALDGVLSASADERGATWTTDATRVSSTTSAIPEGVGAALAPDGTPTFAYAYSFVLGFHFGLDPATADVDLIGGNGCCAYQPSASIFSANCCNSARVQSRRAFTWPSLTLTGEDGDRVRVKLIGLFSPGSVRVITAP
jgi:hypothetical protein